LFSTELSRTGFPFGVVRDERVEPVEPKPLPLEGEDSTAPLEDSTAPLEDSTALGADWTALPRAAPLVPLSPRLPCASAQPDSARTNAAVVAIVLMDFIRLDLLRGDLSFANQSRFSLFLTAPHGS
jgi:hypothetical protein